MCRGMQHSDMIGCRTGAQVGARIPCRLSPDGPLTVCDAGGVLAQSTEPFKLRGEERKNALAEAEAAAEAELSVLISDNSDTWTI